MTWRVVSATTLLLSESYHREGNSEQTLVGSMSKVLQCDLSADINWSLVTQLSVNPLSMTFVLTLMFTTPVTLQTYNCTQTVPIHHTCYATNIQLYTDSPYSPHLLHYIHTTVHRQSLFTTPLTLQTYNCTQTVPIHHTCYATNIQLYTDSPYSPLPKQCSCALTMTNFGDQRYNKHSMDSRLLCLH